MDGAALRTRVHGAGCILLPDSRTSGCMLNKCSAKLHSSSLLCITHALELSEEKVDVGDGVELSDESLYVVQEKLQEAKTKPWFMSSH